MHSPEILNVLRFEYVSALSNWFWRLSWLIFLVLKLEPIDEGRFGEVKRVKYNHETVAVKIFSKSENKNDNDVNFHKEVKHVWV